jgi:predicted MFS family arabinose efflux permease
MALVPALAVFGFGSGIGDVGLNVEAAALERESGRSVLPILHAGFSAGNLIGAGVAVGAITIGISPALHMLCVALLGAASVIVGRRSLPRNSPRMPAETESNVGATSARNAAPVWRDSRLACIGLVVLGMALAEGSGHDWLPIAMVDGYHADKGTAAALYGLFVTAMLIVRAIGGRLIDRFGRVAVLRATAVLGFIGLGLVILQITMWTAALGVFLWGIGAALGFTIALSAAGDDSQRAPSRVSAVASVGFIAFLAGPPVLGYLSHQVGIILAFTVVLVGLVVSTIFSTAVREDSAVRIGSQL